MSEREIGMNKEHSETETHNLELVQVGFERWREGTGSVYDLLAPTAQWTIVGNSVMSKVYRSKQEFMDEVIRPFNATGTARDGKHYTNTYSWYMRMRDGQIVEATAFFDSVEFNDFWTRIAPAV
jgi:ketosteroid isomerase-like protein